MIRYLKNLLSRANASRPLETHAMKLLHLDSSILGEYSVSRSLSAEVVARQVALHHGIEVVYRDLAKEPVQHLSGAHLAVFQGAPVSDPALGADLAAGAAALDELFAADIIVIGAPMYNFSIPSQLKAWIDRVVIAGKTFQYGQNGPEGLLPPGKKVFVVSSRGGVYTGDSPAAALEHQENYLKGVLAFIGLADTTVIRAEGLALGDEAKGAAIAKAQTEVTALTA